MNDLYGTALVAGLSAVAGAAMSGLWQFVTTKTRGPADDATFRRDLMVQVRGLDSRLTAAVILIDRQSETILSLRQSLATVQDQHYECERRSAELAEDLSEASSKIDRLTDELQTLKARVANGERKS